MADQPTQNPPRSIPPTAKYIAPSSLDGMPDEDWAHSLLASVNDTQSALGRMMEDHGIFLQENANVEVLKCRVNVPSPWLAPTYSNSWVDSGGSDQAGRFMKHPDGTVEIQGLIKSGTITNAAFTLPSGYRPAATLKFAVESNGAYGMMKITSAGVVTPQVGNNASFAINCRFLALDSTPVALSCWPVRLQTRFTSAPEFVLVCKARNLSNPTLPSAVDSIPDWRFIRSGNGPTIELKNVNGLSYGDRHELTLLVLGS